MTTSTKLALLAALVLTAGAAYVGHLSSQGGPSGTEPDAAGDDARRTSIPTVGRQPGPPRSRRSRATEPAQPADVHDDASAAAPTGGRSSAPSAGPATAAELLEYLATHVGPPAPRMDLVGDAESFARCFARPDVAGRRVEAAASPWGEPLTAGTTLAFAPGRARWRPDIAAGSTGGDSVRGITVEGAGMDATLVVLDREIRLAGRQTLTLRNLTVDCSDHCLVSVGAAALIRLDRCRVIGFDHGENSGDMVRGTACALWAQDSRIEGGFGTAPGRGYLFNTSPGSGASYTTTLARFDRCVVRGPLDGAAAGGDWLGGSPAKTCLFAACRFVGMAPPSRDGFERPRDGVRFDGCTVTYAAEQDAEPRARRDASELNAGWRRAGEDALDAGPK